jgi:hypothetical protein
LREEKLKVEVIVVAGAAVVRLGKGVVTVRKVAGGPKPLTKYEFDFLSVI